MHHVLDKFLNCVKIDTKSDEESSTVPSTDGQITFAKELARELKDIGMSDVTVDKNCYVMATLPANIDKSVPIIGFIAHMDTAPDLSGENVNPQLINNYDGKDIVLNNEQNIILSPKEFPELKDYVGQTIITTDGKTLLGADDKAGIAEIMTAMEHLIKHPEIPHGIVRVAFTPDEEIGKGADHFDVEKFHADFAYTIDGGAIGEVEYENFNAAGVKIFIHGRNVHPGTAKDKMVNSMLIANEFIAKLPQAEVPQHTEGYEGFYHLTSIVGEVEETKLQYIIRDFDKSGFAKRKENFENIVEDLKKRYGKKAIDIEIKDQYFNMKEKIEPVRHIVDIAIRAMEELNIKPIVIPIRGGTDGARLSFMGLPTPNIFTGGHNFHGKYEFIPAESMEKAVQVIIKIIELYAELGEKG